MGTAVTVPQSAGIAASITLPANNAPGGASLAVAVSNTLPSIVPGIPASSPKLLASLTLTASADVTLQNVPKFSVVLPSSPANAGTFYAWIYNTQTGWINVGSLTVSSKTMTFGGTGKALALKAGVAYAVLVFTAQTGATCPTPGPTPTPPPTPQPMDCTVTTSSVSERVQSARVRRAITTSGELLYVANEEFNSLLVFDANANGNVAPLLNIAGPNCGLSVPQSVAVDASGKIYVANAPDIGIYSISSSGTPNVVGELSGSNTGLSTEGGKRVAVDTAGTLYVANPSPQPTGTATTGPAGILEFAPGANGNVAPSNAISGINARNEEFRDIAVDPSSNIYVSALPFVPLFEFAAGASGDAVPIASLNPSDALQVGPVATDQSGNIYVGVETATAAAIQVYSPGFKTLIATIAGPATGLQWQGLQIAVDSSGKIYASETPVVCEFSESCPGAILVFAPGANGNVAPIATIAGDATGLYLGEGQGAIAVH